MKVITLNYPDSTPNSRILDDLTQLSRDSVGPKGTGATPAFDYDAAPLAGLARQLNERGIKTTDNGT